MQGMGPARRTELLERQFFRRLLSVFCRCVVLSLTLVASKPYEFSHDRTPPKLLNDFGDNARADRLPSFADRKF
jgi:hypothetical protein